MIEIGVSSSHLYPGARLSLAGPESGAAVIRFADGTSATARLEGSELTLAPHTTRAGTRIAAKRWRVARSEDGLRVLAKLSA